MLDQTWESPGTSVASEELPQRRRGSQSRRSSWRENRLSYPFNQAQGITGGLSQCHQLKLSMKSAQLADEVMKR
jgi:hypothetical protein